MPPAAVPPPGGPPVTGDEVTARAPLTGTVISIAVGPGDPVRPGKSSWSSSP